MHTVLIVDSSNHLTGDIKNALRKEYIIFSCSCGADGLDFLSKNAPDGLILNLFLNDIDGLQFLERAGSSRPNAIVILSYIYTPHILQKIKELGNGFPILQPCTSAYIKHRIDDMLKKTKLWVTPDSQRIISTYLDHLGYPKWKSYRMLCVGIPLFSQDPTQLMTKELYPSIAILCGCDNWQQVENRIREGIHWTWENRDNTVWKQYFPYTSQCPTNKEFIEQLAKLLRIENSTVV